MTGSTGSLPGIYRVLTVDDEPDIHTVTKLSLRDLTYNDRPVTIMSATSGKETVEVLRASPEIAVILLDVVMESNSAGLDACRAIRSELKNNFVRIILRTGQPGEAPERETIDTYDIDGYLAKAELTSGRLYAAVRTALKAWDELIELERHRGILTSIHDCVVALHSYEPLDITLERILGTAVSLCPTDLAVLQLETFETKGNPLRNLLFLSTNPDPIHAEAMASDVAVRITRNTSVQSRRVARATDNGYFVPFDLHRELGYGWIFLKGVNPDPLAAKSLSILAAHTANALYSSVAETMLADREGPIYDNLIV